MILKPQTWNRPSYSPAALMTWLAGTLTALVAAQLVLTHNYDSTPPLLIASCTAMALAWIRRMHLARARAESQEDERFIAALRQANAADVKRQREEAAFREISRYLEDH